MDSNFKTSYERMKKKNKTKQQCNNSIEAKFIKWKELLLPNMQQRESFILIMIILFLMFMLIFKAFRGKKLHLIQEFNNALKDKNLFHLPVN